MREKSSICSKTLLAFKKAISSIKIHFFVDSFIW